MVISPSGHANGIGAGGGFHSLFVVGIEYKDVKYYKFSFVKYMVKSRENTDAS